jgi:hypothetical protein
MKRALFIITLLVCSMAIGLSAAEINTAGTFSGKAFFSYSHDFTADRDSTSGQPNGFSFSRIYFGYDRDLDDNFGIRFLMDVENSAGAWRPYMKNAYISMKCKLVEGSRWYIGMVPTALTNVPEASWGYRSIAKMPMDQFSGLYPSGTVRSFGSTADLGLYWNGSLMEKALLVEFNLLNGAGYKAVENDMFKKVNLRPSLFLLDKAITVSAYGSYETVNDSSNALVVSGMVGFAHKINEVAVRVGVEYSLQSLSEKLPPDPGSTDNKSLNSTALAAWAVVDATTKLSVLGRFDIYDPNIDADAKDDQIMYIVGGVDFHPIKNFRIIPNVQMQTFQVEDNAATLMVDESKPINTAFVTFEYSW